MAEHEIKVQEADYLSATNAKILEEPVVIITLRPDEGSFRPHNVAIVQSQAERLLEDLKTLFNRPGIWLMLLAFVGLTGCSADVEVERETRFRPESSEAEVLTTEKTRTAVSVDLLRERGPVVMEDGEAVEVPLDGVLVVHGCLHVHEHLHLTLCEGDRRAERIGSRDCPRVE